MILKMETTELKCIAIRSVGEVFLYPFFGDPLVLLWSPFSGLELSRKMHGALLEFWEIVIGYNKSHYSKKERSLAGMLVLEAKNCRVSRRYASDHSKKTSGLGLRVVIRENVE